MNDQQENKVSMFYAVHDVLNSNSAIWSGVPALVTAVSDLDTVVNGIIDLLQVQESTTKGITRNKAQAEEAMVLATFRTAGAVIAYADTVNDNALAESVRFSVTELSKPRDTIIMARCQLVHDQANANIGALGPFGITPAELATLQSLISDYSNLIQAPRVATSVRAAATADLKILISEGTRILGSRIDGLIEQFRVPNPAFYKSYKRARITIDLGGRRRVEPGTEPPETPSES